MSLLELFKDIDCGTEELKEKEFEGNGIGGGFVKSGGIYKGTIERAFVTETKKGGVQFDLHITGESMFNYRAYPVIVDKKTKKKVTTYTYAGKTQSLADYKLLKQVIYVATGELQELETLKLEEQEIKFKEYGKDVTMTVGMIVDLVGKEIQYAVREEEQYDYEDGETIKSRIKTDDDGNPRYKLTMLNTYSKDGKTALEMVKQTDAEQIEKDREFLSGPKAIKKVKLDVEETDSVTDEPEDEIDF